MEPLFIRKVTADQFHLASRARQLDVVRPIMIWGSTVGEIREILHDVPHQDVSSAEIALVSKEWVAIIRDPSEVGVRIPALCYSVKTSNRKAATLIPVPDHFCKHRPLPFSSNSLHHLRIEHA